MRIAAGSLVAAVAAFAAACGPPAVRPTNYADAQIACPGGRTAWNLDVVDQRADREASEKMIAAVRDGIEKSFPGCRWTTGPAPGAETVTIEIHRFASHLDQTSWEAAAEWTVRAENAGGRTLTEFQANEEVSRPNYRGSDNEKESLTEAYQKALKRTVTGLQALPAIGAFRLPPRTFEAEARVERRSGSRTDSRRPATVQGFPGTAGATEALERDSQSQEES